MNSRSVITLFQQMSEHLESLVAMFGSIRSSIGRAQEITPLLESSQTSALHAASTLHAIEQAIQNFEATHADLNDSLHKLRQRIDQLYLLHEITSQLNDQVSLDHVIDLTMDAMWQKAPLSFAVVILGDTELGPYHYQNMRGVSDAWRFLGRECPFPLWGLLARALIPHLDAAKPDYLIVEDMTEEHRPLPEEFPWMKLEGSLMILPLRIQKSVTGALLLGRSEVNGFNDAELCEDYNEIAKSAAQALQLAQMHQELQERMTQLVGLQLFTKSIASVLSFDEVIQLLTQTITETAGKASVSIILDQSFIQSHSRSEQRTAAIELVDSQAKPFQVYATPLSATAASPESQKPLELSVPVSRLVEWAMQAGQPVFYDPQETIESLERFYYNESGRALLVPIVNNERTLGVIHVVAPDRSQAFDESDMVVLRTIANTTAMMLMYVQPILPASAE